MELAYWIYTRINRFFPDANSVAITRNAAMQTHRLVIFLFSVLCLQYCAWPDDRIQIDTANDRWSAMKATLLSARSGDCEVISDYSAIFPRPLPSGTTSLRYTVRMHYVFDADADLLRFRRARDDQKRELQFLQTSDQLIYIPSAKEDLNTVSLFSRDQWPIEVNDKLADVQLLAVTSLNAIAAGLGPRRTRDLFFEFISGTPSSIDETEDGRKVYCFTDKSGFGRWRITIDPVVGWAPVLCQIQIRDRTDGPWRLTEEIRSRWAANSSSFVPVEIEKHSWTKVSECSELSTLQWSRVNASIPMTEFAREALSLTKGDVVVDETVVPPAIIERVGLPLQHPQSLGKPRVPIPPPVMSNVRKLVLVLNGVALAFIASAFLWRRRKI